MMGGGHGFILPAGVFRWYRGTEIHLGYPSRWVFNYLGKPKYKRDVALGVSGMYIESDAPLGLGWLQTTCKTIWAERHPFVTSLRRQDPVEEICR